MGRHDADEDRNPGFPRAKVYAGVAICVIVYLLGLTMGGFWTSNAQSTPPAPVTVTVTVPAPPPSTTSETTTTTRKRSSE